MLQERISELGSGILQIRGNEVYLTGFMSPERLHDYYDKNIDCHFSHGIYPNRELNWGKIQDNAMFIVLNKDNEVVNKYQFLVIKKDIVRYKDKDNTNRIKTYIIRKCQFTGLYNFIARETIFTDGKKTTVEDNKIFNSLDELNKFFINTFGTEFKYNEN